MSVVHENLQRGSGSVRTWYLRAADGAVYPPVQLSVLCEWAAQSRIVPGNEISENGQTWMPVESLPELKLEWMAELPEGKTYGPFNVLAVPFLFNSGTLPADAKLVNPSTGKTLQVRDILKSSVPSESKTRVVALDEKDPKWEERYHEEKRTRLLHEAQLQQTIDRLTGEAKTSTDALKETQERVQREATEYEQLKQRSRAMELQLKQGVEQLQAELRSVKSQLETADRDLAEQRRSNETVNKQSVSSEEKLKEQVDRLKRELQLTTTSHETARKDLADERRNIEAVRRQAQLKEQELSRGVEEARKDVEGRAGLLEKTTRDLQMTDVARAEAQARAKEEEARLKGRLDKQEKELQAALRELAELRKRSQMLEKENAQREARIQAQAAEFKKKSDALTAELERLKKETESHRSLQAEMGKSTTDREGSLKREALFARSAMVKAEHELAGLKKQHDALKEQSAWKESELESRVELSLDQLRRSGEDVERLTREAAERTEGFRALEQRTKYAETELAGVRAQLGGFQQDAQQRRQEGEEQVAALQKEKAALAEIQSREESENDRLMRKANELESENRRLGGVAAQTKEEAAGLTRALEAARREAAAGAEQLARSREQLEVMKGAGAEAHVRFEQEKAALEKQVESLQDAARRANESLAEQKQRAEAMEEERRRQEAEREARAADAEALRKEIESHKAAKVAEEQAAAALRKELAEQMERYEGMLAQESEQDGVLQKRCASIEAELRKKEEELNQQVRALKDEVEQMGQERREQEERHLQIEREYAEDQETIAAQIAGLETRLADAIKGRDESAGEKESLKALLAAAGEKHGREMADLLKRLEAAEAGGSEAGRKLAAEEDREVRLRAESHGREAQSDGGAAEWQAEAARATGAIKMLERQLAAQKEENQAAERKAEAFAQEADRVRTELLKVRQQHEALQGVIKSQEKAARPAAVPSEPPTAPEEEESRTPALLLRTAAAVVVLAACSYAAFQIGSRRGRDVGRQAGLQEATERPPLPAVAPAQTAAVEPSKGVEWPKISVAGVTVKPGVRECALVFDDAVFSYRATIAAEAAEPLRAVASQIRDRISEFTLIVEGHTDTTPVSSDASGNKKLGLARANAVVDFLKNTGGLPEGSMRAASKGEEDPPYPNDDEASRLKNRTVILKLVPKERK